jgi:hypothetical protein
MNEFQKFIDKNNPNPLPQGNINQNQQNNTEKRRQEIEYYIKWLHGEIDSWGGVADVNKLREISQKINGEHHKSLASYIEETKRDASYQLVNQQLFQLQQKLNQADYQISSQIVNADLQNMQTRLNFLSEKKSLSTIESDEIKNISSHLNEMTGSNPSYSQSINQAINKNKLTVSKLSKLSKQASELINKKESKSPRKTNEINEDEISTDEDDNKSQKKSYNSEIESINSEIKSIEGRISSADSIESQTTFTGEEVYMIGFQPAKVSMSGGKLNISCEKLKDKKANILMALACSGQIFSTSNPLIVPEKISRDWLRSSTPIKLMKLIQNGIVKFENPSHLEHILYDYNRVLAQYSSSIADTWIQQNRKVVNQNRVRLKPNVKFNAEKIEASSTTSTLDTNYAANNNSVFADLASLDEAERRRKSTKRLECCRAANEARWKYWSSLNSCCCSCGQGSAYQVPQYYNTSVPYVSQWYQVQQNIPNNNPLPPQQQPQQQPPANIPVQIQTNQNNGIKPTGNYQQPNQQPQPNIQPSIRREGDNLGTCNRKEINLVVSEVNREIQTNQNNGIKPTGNYQQPNQQPQPNIQPSIRREGDNLGTCNREEISLNVPLVQNTIATNQYNRGI